MLYKSPRIRTVTGIIERPTVTLFRVQFNITALFETFNFNITLIDWSKWNCNESELELCQLLLIITVCHWISHLDLRDLANSLDPAQDPCWIQTLTRFNYLN